MWFEDIVKVKVLGNIRISDKLVDDILEHRWRGVGGGNSEEDSSTALGPVICGAKCCQGEPGL